MREKRLNSNFIVSVILTLAIMVLAAIAGDYYFDLNDWTTYVVEDLVAEHLPEYYYEIKFMPKEQ